MLANYFDLEFQQKDEAEKKEAPRAAHYYTGQSLVQG
jgi:hypothetical protein